MNSAPLLAIELTQDGQAVSVIDPDNGMVELVASITDINQQDTFNVSWMEVNNLIADGEGISYQFDPSLLNEGEYRFNVTAQEANTAELLSVTQSVLVEQLAPLQSGVDSDGDGIADDQEGYGDSDGDGIADYLDSDDNPTLLPVASGERSMSVPVGNRLKIGRFVKSLFGSAS
ncbi:MAG: hypothetical protein GY787_00735 [Alteromonadales bacterium]|nr:hypothetical protein [Alteromonadales bacterium]